MENVTPQFDAFVDIQKLHPLVQSMFETEDSLRWFIRRNRALLVDAGALIVVTGRLRFHPTRFKQAVLEVGQRAAA